MKHTSKRRDEERTYNFLSSRSNLTHFVRDLMEYLKGKYSPVLDEDGFAYDWYRKQNDHESKILMKWGYLHEFCMERNVHPLTVLDMVLNRYDVHSERDLLLFY